ncbi:A24 family peptidase [Rhodopirellula sp. SWK7]|uniref:A24 family peptidase n=1 Tax=Rhodopirellula sp. SWK7 TaxID=595460 RepID=UPI0002BF3610|nr:prepilin peptidase [Rhodopirellula sp. SWK7]EMI40500.1 membrane protein containing Peptidase A24A [Rhodopirellula sp. SWK7]
MSRQRRPYRSVAFLVLLGYIAVAALYVLVAGWAVASGHLRTTGHWHGSFGQTLLPRINDVVVFTFFLVCGASVGSFLNVVVWRMPQGLSVNGHSFCPRCRNTLRARDNVPVFGWLWLGGRCRDCRLPISPRYPIVEAAVAITFATIGTAEIYAWNLPYRSFGFQLAMASPRVDGGQLIIVLYHLVAMGIMWAMALIRYDRNRIPGRLVLFATFWLVGGMLLVPSAAVVPWQLKLPAAWPPSDWMFAGGRPFDPATLVQSFVRVLTALVAAGFYARVLARAFCPRADLKLDPLGDQTSRLLDLVLLIAVVSILIGWQATSGVLLFASLLACGVGVFFSKPTNKTPAATNTGIDSEITGPEISHVSPSLRSSTGFVSADTDALGRFSLCLPVALLLQILLWRSLALSDWWPSEQAPRGVLLGFALATLFIPLWLREPRQFGQSDFPSDDSPEELNSGAPE